MFWKVLRHVLVPSSGLEENNIKGAFSPVVPYYPPSPLPLPQEKFHIDAICVQSHENNAEYVNSRSGFNAV